MRTKLMLSLLFMVSVMTFLIEPAPGKEYPKKPIEFVCAYAHSNDIMLRIVADIAPKYLWGNPPWW